MIVDILICTNQEVLNHKIQDVHNPDLEVFWTFNKRPKKLALTSRIWFAIRGVVQGCFSINRIEDKFEETWMSGPQMSAKIPLESPSITDVDGRVWTGVHVFFKDWVPWNEILKGSKPPTIIPSQGFRYIYPGDFGVEKE